MFIIDANKISLKYKLNGRSYTLYMYAYAVVFAI